MTKEEFELRYATRSKVTVEWLHQHHQFGVTCDCGEANCLGWQMKSRHKPFCKHCGGSGIARDGEFGIDRYDFSPPGRNPGCGWCGTTGYEDCEP